MRTSGSQGRPAQTHPRTRGQGVADRPYTHVPTRHGAPRCTAFVTGPVRAGRIVGRGHQQPHRAPTTRPAPPGRRSGRARTARAATPGGPAPPRWPVPVHRPRRTTRRRGHRSHRPEPWDPPTQAPPTRASPCKRGARSGATTPGGTATPCATTAQPAPTARPRSSTGTPPGSPSSRPHRPRRSRPGTRTAEDRPHASPPGRPGRAHTPTPPDGAPHPPPRRVCGRARAGPDIPTDPEHAAYNNTSTPISPHRPTDVKRPSGHDARFTQTASPRPRGTFVSQAR